MASKARRGDHAPGSEPRAAVAADGGALDAALDRLHRAPLEQFVQVRGEIVKELRAAGDAATARAVGAAKKPARTAWALNQLARHRPELLRDVFEAHDAALKSQRSGDPEEVRATARAYREKIAAVVRAAHEILGDAGGELNAAQSRRIGETMQAGATGGEAVREQLLSGRLVEDLDVDDPFGGMEVGERAPGKHHAKEGTHAADKGREKEHGGGREQGGGKEHAAAREHAAA
ncbi:MAG: hypothetical protein JOZ69_25725, partial [Myxococcales bacterium]|nr:hypothetical protein [Myxococcales bacterium]